LKDEQDEVIENSRVKILSLFIHILQLKTFKAEALIIIFPSFLIPPLLMSITFKPSLKLLDATMIVAGSMIGSGIFIVSADIIRNVGSAGWLIAVWLITGFMTVTAALSYGELSGMFPKAGGQYVYLKEAYNPLIGFLYGWSFFAVIQTATIAAVAVAFAKFAAYIFPAFSEDIIAFHFGNFAVSPAQLLAMVVITLLTYINTKGIKSGKIIQTSFTMTKLLSLFGLIIFGLLVFKSDVWNHNWSNAWSMHQLKKDGSVASYTTIAALGAVAAAMVGSIFSSDSWNNVTFIAGEIKNPKKNIGLSLFLGTLIVTIIYVAANFVYTAVLPLEQIASAEKDRVGVAASQVIFGNAGTTIIALMIMISTFGCDNGIILAGARVYHAMAVDKLFFKKIALLNKNAVPANALWLQCIFACAWCLSGKYGDLLDMISFVVVVFYMLTIAGIFILRKKNPDAERPYKAFGYPVLPVIYILMGLSFCILLIKFKPTYTWPGLIIALLGIPIYYLAIGQKKSTIKQKKDALVIEE
jgi:APA family basic amino acid/polyamine antiporter